MAKPKITRSGDPIERASLRDLEVGDACLIITRLVVGISNIDMATVERVTQTSITVRPDHPSDALPTRFTRRFGDRWGATSMSRTHLEPYSKRRLDENASARLSNDARNALRAAVSGLSVEVEATFPRGDSRTGDMHEITKQIEAVILKVAAVRKAARS